MTTRVRLVVKGGAQPARDASLEVILSAMPAPAIDKWSSKDVSARGGGVGGGLAGTLTVHTPTPAAAAVPAGHITETAVVAPGPQAYPAVHGPLQVAADSPAAEPKRPTGHGTAVAFVLPAGQ
jgi:hypothetical protein